MPVSQTCCSCFRLCCTLLQYREFELSASLTYRFCRRTSLLSLFLRPAAIVPSRDVLDKDTMEEVEDNSGRAERVFKAHIFRGPEGPKDRHEFEVIVCHGNLIRYFFCRTLQLPPEAWLRMSLFNCSITYLVLRPSGFVSARMLGDIGHLDYDQCSFSMNHGFVW